MLAKLFQWLMIGILIVLSLWFVSVFGEVFRSHVPIFLFLWFFTPVLAFWVASKRISSQMSPSNLWNLRLALTLFAALISFGFFAHHNQLRDSVGYSLVAGYHVEYSEDTADDGTPTVSSDVSTYHWYSRVLLWIFEILFLFLCVFLPYITWKAISRVAESAARRTIQH